MKQFLILLFLNYMICQERLPLPTICQPNAEIQDRQCCIFPPFFTRDVAKQCGGKTIINAIDEVNNVTLKRRHANKICEHWRCVLSKYGLINDEEFLDDEKFFAHLDLWVDLNPLFSDVISNAKSHCKYNVGITFPIGPCLFIQLLQCIRNYVTVDCPDRLPTPECKELADYYARCKEFYFRKK